MSEGYRLATRFFSVVIIGFGVAIVVVTLVNSRGGFPIGLVIGAVFVAMGCARLYLAMRGQE